MIRTTLISLAVASIMAAHTGFAQTQTPQPAQPQTTGPDVRAVPPLAPPAVGTTGPAPAAGVTSSATPQDDSARDQQAAQRDAQALRDSVVTLHQDRKDLRR